MSDAQRTSTAVMQRRHEARDSLDFFPTPPWATRALFEHVLPRVLIDEGRANPASWLATATALDPCCGEMHMAGVIGEYVAAVRASDVHAYEPGATVADFLDHNTDFDRADLVVMNPPFVPGEDFVLRALSIADEHVCVLVRSAFLEGGQRWQNLFRRVPPTHIFQFVERVAMTKDRWVVNGSTATPYSWLVFAARPSFAQRANGPVFRWIPPCRLSLSREIDPIRFDGWYRRKDVVASAAAGTAVWVFDRARYLAIAEDA